LQRWLMVLKLCFNLHAMLSGHGIHHRGSDLLCDMSRLPRRLFLQYFWQLAALTMPCGNVVIYDRLDSRFFLPVLRCWLIFQSASSNLSSCVRCMSSRLLLSCCLF
jgi:hypothetical protein